VKAGTWFGSHADPGVDFSLVGCTVSPGFDFADFELADPAALRAEFPKGSATIDKLCVGLPSGGLPSGGSSKAGKAARHRASTVQSVPLFRTSDSEKPRQLLLSLCLISVIAIMTNRTDTSVASDKEAFTHAFAMGFIAFQMFVFLQVRDLITSWPHPGFWRLVFGAGSMYVPASERASERSEEAPI
jgi:hypothetical protein